MPELLQPDFDLRNYAFDLPEELIAQSPAPERTASRLMVLDRRTGTTKTGHFCDILEHLPENCLLIANNSRVVPARVSGSRPGGGKVEMLLLSPLPVLTQSCRPSSETIPGWLSAHAEVLLRPAKKIREGELVSLSDDLAFSLLEKRDFGRCLVRLNWQGDLAAILERCGSMPLPPYIRRPKPEEAGGTDAVSPSSAAKDRERYQTVYARADKAGSVAAPTAGLHFTPEMQELLRASGREWAEVTLYVGYGTFSPVRCRDIREHAMHAEYVELPESTAAAIAGAKKEGRPVIAVGTTSTRTLEGLFTDQHPGNQSPDAVFAGLQPYSGWINTFLYPGKKFHVIDGLITNFHLPESSLLMLISALAGRERVLRAYKEAVDKKFRFFSYGDAMLIL